ncbi:MAG: hypothetical protein JXX14_26205 [Deltaproteobacteria bacterium]|nr:hypothetical protein [Deltaproteobacteria bacterium]
MKEASSRYVDQITLEKLLSEKLEKVHHFPETGLNFPGGLFDDFNEYSQRVEQSLATGKAPLATSENGYLFNSLVPSIHTENQSIPVHVFLSATPKMNLVFYHGLFEENREIYHFLFSNLNRLGISVFLCTMPYHYERMPAPSAFSGEFFWSAYFERTRNAFKQAVYDLHYIAAWVSHTFTCPAVTGGFSMGGAVALIHASLCHRPNGVVALNPAVSLSDIVWDSPLCRTIKADYKQAGYELKQLQNAYADFEPICYAQPQTPAEKIFLGYGCYDLVTSPDLYRSLVKHWDLCHTMEYKSGHLNLLRVPRVANDLYNFWYNTEAEHHERSQQISF